jgi:hypothetical protein
MTARETFDKLHPGVNYRTYHKQLVRARGKASEFPCSMLDDTCSTGVMDWACVSGKYRDFDDFVPLCRSHHKRMDHNPETSAKMSIAGRNHPPNNPRVQGELNPFFGRKHSDETKAKMRGPRPATSKAQMGRKRPESVGQKISCARLMKSQNIMCTCGGH